MTPEPPPAVVLDTNVVLDWLVFGNPEMAALAAAIEGGALRWLCSDRMRAEIAEVVARPALEGWEHHPEQVLTIVDRHAERCADPDPGPLTCDDRADQVFIDLALARQARWLVTRDKALLRLAVRAARSGTTICRPAAWAAVPAR